MLQIAEAVRLIDPNLRVSVLDGSMALLVPADRLDADGRTAFFALKLEVDWPRLRGMSESVAAHEIAHLARALVRRDCRDLAIDDQNMHEGVRREQVPEFGKKTLRFVCGPDRLEAVLGDSRRASTGSRTSAGSSQRAAGTLGK